MSAQPQPLPIPAPGPVATADGAPRPVTPSALVEAQSRRIQELEQRLAARTRVLTDAAQALAQEIRRREEVQAALFEAQKLEALGHLAGGLAHDLRNVLGVMGLGYDLVEQRSADPPTLRVVGSGRRALKQAHGLIEALLGMMRRREEPEDLLGPAAWLPQMEDLLGYATGSRVSCRLCPAPDCWPVRVQEHRLGAALINLAVNARDAMPDGGELTVTAVNLRRGAARPAQVPEGDFVLLSVADTGCGMTQEVLNRATDPLFTTKPPGQGTGLGLAMVRGFAAAAGGHLVIASRPGEGTRVELYLPRAEGDFAPVVAGMPRPAPVGSLLLVDDDDLMRPALAAQLRELGYRVVEASSAEVALALLPTLPRLELVVADLVLPGADGVALVRDLRLERPGLPALFITGYDCPEAPLGDIPVLRKPFSREQLTAAVQAQASKVPSRRERQAEMLDRLAVRLRSPDLLTALLGWRDARRDAVLPGLEAVRGIAPALADHSFIAARDGDGEPVRFRFLSVGQALVARLGRPLNGRRVDPADEDLVGTLAAAYQRAARTGLPSYEYLRYALGDGPPVLFERLILPLADDGERVSHLIGMVLFANIPSTEPQVSTL